MEAGTVPATATPEATPEVETPQAPETQTPAAPEWQAPIEDLGQRLGEVSEGMRALMSRIPEPEPEPEPNYAEQLGELFEEAGGAPDPAQLEQFIAQRIEAGVQQGVSQVQAQVGQIQQTLTNQEIDALEDRFPELKEGDAGAKLVDAAVERAQAWGVPQISAQFLETVHLAMKAGELAQQETPAGQGPEAHLETGGGAAPAQPEGNRWESIKNAGVPSGPLW